MRVDLWISVGLTVFIASATASPQTQHLSLSKLSKIKRTRPGEGVVPDPSTRQSPGAHAENMKATNSEHPFDGGEDLPCDDSPLSIPSPRGERRQSPNLISFIAPVNDAIVQHLAGTLSLGTPPPPSD